MSPPKGPGGPTDHIAGPVPRTGYLLANVWAHLGSNQGPTGYEPVALPAELWAHKDLLAVYVKTAF